MDTAAEKEARRGDIERTHATDRDNREKQYIADKNDLEAAYRSDLADIAEARITAFVGAGLNPDGSDPQGRPVGHQD